ncbi:glutathione transferase F5 [Coccidioides immitis H538.4]|uniref:glutathione transferase n=3 Tax=Coccidioides immitis TaxID=5501 RepID=A0A0J8RAM1_COCIT|nr:glutathione transferase F5 [Coccidioides immitis RMSCC 2394]KMU81485.1 glutathione transferase F5 [Coccidioides immitis RMSCC 3703]KMU83865.1 glutathione transferase F5 [Coccidioides immitis H538.4]
MAGKLKIYGNIASPYSDIVLLTAAEGGLKDYDYVNVDFRKGAHKLSPHEPDGKISCSHNPGRRPSLRVSPNGEIHRHTLQLHRSAPGYQGCLGSRAIRTSRVPRDVLLRRSRGRASVTIPVDEAAVAKVKSQLESHLDLCEQSFKAGKEYMAGDTFGLADIFYIPAVAKLIDVGHGDLITKREMVNDWWQRCLARPATGDYVQNIPKPVDMKQALDRAN